MIRLAAAVATAALALTASPASAHTITAYQGEDRAWVSSDHTRLHVDDNECDSHQVRAYYKTEIMVLANAPAKWFHDQNGCDPGTSTLTTGSGGYAVERFWVCEYHDETGDLVCGDHKTA